MIETLSSYISSLPHRQSEEEEHEVLTAAAAAAVGSDGYLAFQGSGSRLDGKKKNLQTPLKELVQNVR